MRLTREALATRDLRALQLASLAAGVGGWAFMVSLAVHAYAVGGTAAVGLAALVRMAPAGVAAPLTGLAADRYSRRDVLLAATLIRAVLLAAAALVVALQAPFALLLVLATVFTVAATAHKPAQAALLPHLAPDTTRQAASNALWTASTTARSWPARSPGACSSPRSAQPPRSRERRSRSPSRPRRSLGSGESPRHRPERRQPGVRPSAACASWRATRGCGCSSACCPRPPSSRGWSTSWSSWSRSISSG